MASISQKYGGSFGDSHAGFRICATSLYMYTIRTHIPQAPRSLMTRFCGLPLSVDDSPVLDTKSALKAK